MNVLLQGPNFTLTGPPDDSRFFLTDLKFVTGNEFDQWKYVTRHAASNMVTAYPGQWVIKNGELMSVANTVNEINAGTMAHAPVILGTILAVENAVGGSIPGATKAEIVINSVMAGAQAASQSSNVTVSSIAQLTALFVSILNATGIFKHAAVKP